MTRVVAFAFVFLSGVSIIGQEFQEGTWGGTLNRLIAGNPRPQRQKFALEFKKAPDPHWAWRPGSSDAWSVTVIGQQGRSQATDVRFDGETLAFKYRRQDFLMSCGLTRQPDGTFEGDCLSDGEQGVFRVSLTPAKAAAK
jgi:hypothetical protein